MEMEGMPLKKPLPPNCPPRHLHVVPPVEAECEFSPVFANPTSLNKEEEGRMVKDTDAGDGIFVKTPGGRQRGTTSLLFPRIWLVRLRGESLLREVIEGRMIGKRPRGRKRLGMLNEFL